MLSISRVINCSGIPSLSTITDRSASQPTASVLDEFRGAIKSLEWSIEKPEWKNYHLSLKQGPSGQAMLGSIIDLHNLSDKQLLDIGTLGGPGIEENIEMLKSVSLEKWIEKFDLSNRLATRRLSVVHAPEGKERVIAIFDYWSQTVLKPLHDSTMSFLKTIKSDMTFNQTSHSGKLPITGPYYSLDLHAATDRFPVSVQHAVLSHFVKDQEYADAWLRTMIDYEFENPWAPPVKYAVGQPMGAYSSWAIFALTHHLSVRVAALRAGQTVDFKDYILLGDDIVIANKSVADEYLKLMNELGVTISAAKSHVSNDTFEFAKRWYQAGTEITGIQLSAFISCRNWSTAAEELQAQLARWSIVPSALEIRVIRAYLGALGQRARDANKVNVYLNLPREVDSDDETYNKHQFLGLLWFQDSLSCNHGYNQIKQLLVDCLAEAKAEILHDGLSNVEKQYANITYTMLDGLVDQSALSSVPIVGALKSEKRKLSRYRELVDDLHWNLDERLSFSRFSLSACDPISVTQKRGHEILASNLATVTHYCATFAKEYCQARSLLFGDGPVPKTISRFR